MERNGVARVMMSVALVCASVPLFAQDQVSQTATPPAAESQPTRNAATNAQLDRLRADVGTFEIVLQRAVDKAALEITQWAEAILPNIPLVQEAPPVAHGVPAGDASLTFNVEVSGLLGVNLWQTVQGRQRPNPDPNVRVGTQPNTVIQGDPMAGPPASLATSASITDHYSEFVRQAMIDAILDQSGVLPLKDEQTLAVAVIPVSASGPAPRSRTLVLSIKGTDLAMLRQGKISRDEAKRRITETRF